MVLSNAQWFKAVVSCSLSLYSCVVKSLKVETDSFVCLFLCKLQIVMHATKRLGKLV